METKTLKTLIIAIDGYSGTGKSTSAKLVAKKLGIRYLDTGAMYRAVTWLALENKLAVDKTQDILHLLSQSDISFDSSNLILIDNVVREKEIRTPLVSDNVSHYCKIPEVREYLTEMQRKIGNSVDCILDGRDIGTTVFPNATYKFFLKSDYKVRAQRRYIELTEHNVEITLEEVENNLRERDDLDTTRTISPLVKAEDAIELDTTSMTIDEQVEFICSRVQVAV